jgi:hypothetical protein
MTESQEPLRQQHRRAGDFATISRWLLRELDAIATQYIEDSPDKGFARRDVAIWTQYLTAIEERELGTMMRLREQMGRVPGG